jgi:hypothetical protein
LHINNRDNNRCAVIPVIRLPRNPGAQRCFVAVRIGSNDKRRGFMIDGVADGASKFLRTKRNYDTFAIRLEALRERKGLTPVKLYTDALIDKRLYSKIMSKSTYHPNKNTVLSLGFALKLTMDEMNTLLASAGYSLSQSIVSDLIIMFCIENKIYNLHDVNELLDKSKQKMLCRETV